MATTLATQLVLDALNMAPAMQRPKGVSLRPGPQYMSIEFGHPCREAGAALLRTLARCAAGTPTSHPGEGEQQLLQLVVGQLGRHRPVPPASRTRGSDSCPALPANMVS
jgi:hypothetical protein